VTASQRPGYKSGASGGAPARPSEDDIAAGTRLCEQPWRFVLGVANLDQLPPSGPVEIAFAGRSNVGKSSLINALVRQNGLARTSNTPGRTQELNFFAPESAGLYLVDMPGYGFAKAPRAKVEAWTQLIKSYLAGRPRLARVFLLVDARHGLKPVDEAIMKLMDEAAVAYQIVLTKSDKIAPQDLDRVITRTGLVLTTHTAAYPHVLASSSQTGFGIPELRASVARLVDDFSSGTD
jgi:GTP-binding protein